MFVTPRPIAQFGISASLVAVMLLAAPRPVVAAEESATAFQYSLRAWMGVVALLADGSGEDRDDAGEERCEECRKKERGKHRHGHHGHVERWGHAGGEGRRPARPHGEFGMMPPGGSRPQVVMGRLDEIVARLSRIEAKLESHGGRAAGAERREGHPPRPPMPAEMREMVEKRMQEARKRMDEGRERMEQARKRFQEMEERIRTLEAEVERLKAAQK